jgi:hypothetical protein
LLADRRKAIWVYFRIADQPAPLQALVLGMLPAVLDGRMPPELLERLERWNERKRAALSCQGQGSDRGGCC